jgi:hypothetical protein
MGRGFKSLNRTGKRPKKKTAQQRKESRIMYGRCIHQPVNRAADGKLVCRICGDFL